MYLLKQGINFVRLPALVVEGLFCGHFSWRQLVEGIWLELVVYMENINLKKLPDPRKGFVGS